MTKLTLTPTGQFFIEEETENGTQRTEINGKLVAKIDVEKINPFDSLNVKVTFMVDEIDLKYSTDMKRRDEERAKLRNELRQET